MTTRAHPDTGQSWRIPCLVPDLPGAADVHPYLAEMHAARWYSNFGPLVTRFEAAMGAFLAASRVDGDAPLHVVSVASATGGLDLAVLAADLPPRSRILVPAVTFPATLLAVHRAGHVPVIADVDPQCWALTPTIARQALSGADIAAVMPVAPFGYPLPTADWAAFQAETGAPVLMDVAASLGQQLVHGDVPAVFSLHATKPFGVGEGGLVVTGSASLADRVRRQSNFGFSRGVIVEPGTNAKMAEVLAAYGLAQLDRWQDVRAARLALAARYRAALDRAGLADRLGLGPLCEGISPATFPVDTGERAGPVMAALAAAGIQTRQWYLPPLHHHPAFADCARVSGDLPVADRLHRSLVGLPFHVFLSDGELDSVCATLKDALDG
ncbi:DegT/DnrJ/EryC1/StrS family aminotransferase [Yunchengibacter salinarum]|uniref:DegT/DnrJ/EryC1/StrS family aminotransferase n=1 Tax=Yunchengibacter salinarum TaxID=3133399 RepID=UPI0035B598E0